MKKNGFTLIELLIVISIIATIIAFAVPNFLGARQRANDTKKKAELVQLKNALRIYYNDYATYPENYNGGTGKLNYIKGCGADHVTGCPCSASLDFAAGGTGCEVIYMKKFPSDLGNLTMSYYQASNGDDFCLKVSLENASDPDISKSQTKCGATVSGAPCYQKASGNDFAVCAD